MNYNQPPLVFVYLGDKLPSYIEASMKLACETSYCDVVMLSDGPLDIEHPKYNNILNSTFYDKSEFNEIARELNFNKTFWDGFWLKTLERFFVLKQWMYKNNVQKVFHAEADNIIFNLEQLSQKLDGIGQYMFVPRDSSERAIASLIYINNYESLNHFCKFTKRKNSFTNEMEILNAFMNDNKSLTKALPVDLAFYSHNKFDFIEPKLSEGIFDAAALGQWLFGIDMRHLNTPLYNNFKNENSSPFINEFKFEYDHEKSKFHVLHNGKLYNLYNLHVHSKIHKKIADKDFLQDILRKKNQGQITMLDLNTLGIFKGIYKKLKKPLILISFIVFIIYMVNN